MYDVMLDLFGLFGLDLSAVACDELTMSQIIPMILVASMVFCIVGGILRCVNRLVELSVGGFGLRR